MPGVRYGFSTKPIDQETNYCYFGYRLYDSGSGRWLSRDPVGEKGGPNIYCFVNNNPVSFIDYLGLSLSVDSNTVVEGVIANGGTYGGLSGQGLVDVYNEVRADVNICLFSIRTSTYYPNSAVEFLDNHVDTISIQPSDTSVGGSFGVYMMLETASNMGNYTAVEFCGTGGAKECVKTSQPQFSRCSLLVHELTHAAQARDPSFTNEVYPAGSEDRERWEMSAEKEAVEEANRYRQAVGEKERYAYWETYFNTNYWTDHHVEVQECPSSEIQ